MIFRSVAVEISREMRYAEVLCGSSILNDATPKTILVVTVDVSVPGLLQPGCNIVGS